MEDNHSILVRKLLYPDYRGDENHCPDTSLLTPCKTYKIGRHTVRVHRNSDFRQMLQQFKERSSIVLQDNTSSTSGYFENIYLFETHELLDHKWENDDYYEQNKEFVDALLKGRLIDKNLTKELHGYKVLKTFEATKAFTKFITNWENRERPPYNRLNAENLGLEKVRAGSPRVR